MESCLLEGVRNFDISGNSKLGCSWSYGKDLENLWVGGTAIALAEILFQPNLQNLKHLSIDALKEGYLLEHANALLGLQSLSYRRADVAPFSVIANHAFMKLSTLDVGENLLEGVLAEDFMPLLELRLDEHHPQRQVLLQHPHIKGARAIFHHLPLFGKERFKESYIE